MQRFAICNETWQDTPWDTTCAAIAAAGYDGVEIAPFTLTDDVRKLNAAQRGEIRRVAEGHGLAIVGLHWLLMAPKGLHLHTRNDRVRQETADYLKALADFAGDLGAPVMILGSPFQRTLEDGDFAGAWSRTREVIRQALPTLAARDVILCQESLPLPECDFIQTAAEAAQLVREIDHPHYRLMLDVKSMCAEDRPPAAIIREFAPLVKHLHANDANRRGPGFGDTDFRPIAQAAKDVGFSGWVSVEVFDYTPDPDTIARDSLSYLKEVWAA